MAIWHRLTEKAKMWWWSMSRSASFPSFSAFAPSASALRWMSSPSLL